MDATVAILTRMHYLGLDIGGTKCAVCAGRTEGDTIRLLARFETPTLDPSATFAALDSAISTYIEAFSPTRVGISCGGPLDSAGGVILSPPNLPAWHGFEIVRHVRETYGLDAALENDANACAVAEWRFGAGRGAQSMVFLTFGTGLGAGLILDGKLYRGANGNAGEAGHIRLCEDGPVGFGKRGSFEGFCSGGGIARQAKLRAQEAETMPDCIVRMGGIERVTARALAEAASEGDAFAADVFAACGRKLGRGLAVLVDLLNPRKIVLGGVFMRSASLMLPAMHEELRREALADSLSVCEILPAGLGERIGDVAALAVAEGIGL